VHFGTRLDLADSLLARGKSGEVRSGIRGPPAGWMEELRLAGRRSPFSDAYTQIPTGFQDALINRRRSPSSCLLLLLLFSPHAKYGSIRIFAT
jgi:hypothetical protein